MDDGNEDDEGFELDDGLELVLGKADCRADGAEVLLGRDVTCDGCNVGVREEEGCADWVKSCDGAKEG